MNRSLLVSIVLAAAVAGAGAGYWYATKRASHGSIPEASVNAPDPGRRVLYWHDPMVPGRKFDKPGKSPFMDMQLVPVYADEKAHDGGVSVSARAQQNLGVRTAVAEVAELRQDVPAVGYVQADERRIARVEVRAPGWVEKLHVRAVNDPVRAGQVLAEIYSPELLAAQEEYLLARRMGQANAADAPLAEAARRRLELLGVPEPEIMRLESTGAVSRRVPILAPIPGVVSELTVREGAMVNMGVPAFTLTDLSSLWITVEVPEAQGTLLKPGQRAEARVQSVPGRTFEGHLDFIYPELNAQTRTAKARVTVPNPGLALKPGMFAEVKLVASARKALTVPSEAVIQTGTRSVVVVADGERFRTASVKIGAETGGRTEILAGLKPGERVVASGQFLIDSEASLKATLERFDGTGETAPATAPGSKP
jgi:Cu(I)/Ag(I) efflux system membrane fusion protein